jgi:hypothetical protein
MEIGNHGGVPCVLDIDVSIEAAQQGEVVGHNNPVFFHGARIKRVPCLSKPRLRACRLGVAVFAEVCTGSAAGQPTAVVHHERLHHLGIFYVGAVGHARRDELIHEGGFLLSTVKGRDVV